MADHDVDVPSRRDAIGRLASLAAIAATGVPAAAAAASAAATGDAAPLDERTGWPLQPPDPADLPPNTPPWMRAPGGPLVGYGSPSKYEAAVVRLPTTTTPTEVSSWNFTPLQYLRGIVTPNGLHYERSHAGTTEIDPAQHRLLVDGMVRTPVVLTMDDLLRYPTVSRLHFLECSGNTGSEWHEPTGPTVQFTHGLLSCAEWTGVPLRAVLDDLGVARQARWALAEGADAAAMSRSVPVSKLLDDALLAFAQNGEMLRPAQGYPVRLLLPGYEGNMSVKWLRRLTFGPKPFETYEETAYYTELMGDGRARQFNFVMEAKSVITFPSAKQTLPKPGYYEISGLAWSGNGRVRLVDVSTDAGRTWHRAELQQPVQPKCLTRFRYDWTWDGSPAVLQSRCTDDAGVVQPTRAALVARRGGLNSHYHYNAIQSWALAADGALTNVFA